MNVLEGSENSQYSVSFRRWVKVGVKEIYTGRETNFKRGKRRFKDLGSHVRSSRGEYEGDGGE